MLQYGSGQRLPSALLAIGAAALLSLLMAACKPSASINPASPVDAAAPLNLCASNSGSCKWYAQGQQYSDCVAASGLGYGCNWKCGTFWCASSSSADRDDTASTSVAASNICTMTTTGGNQCAATAAATPPTPAPPPAPVVPTSNLCGQPGVTCSYAGAQQIFADCTVNGGVGFGCNWKCGSLWCSSASQSNATNTSSTAVSMVNRCTVTGANGTPCAD